jgi:5-methylcytosine-specific restriction endonuclease McrA
MRFIVQVRIEPETNSQSDVIDIAVIERDRLTPATLGLTIEDANRVLAGVQHVVAIEHCAQALSAVEHCLYDSIAALAPLGRCPVCGIDRIHTLDHVLPKSAFPEFSVAPLNLVPSCFACNLAKSSAVASGLPDEPFHPYFDSWERMELFDARLRWAPRFGVEFEICADPLRLPPPLAKRAEYHFRLFNLRDRYFTWGLGELSDRIGALLRVFETSRTGALAEELLWNADNEARRGRPFARAFYRALAVDDDFCQGRLMAVPSLLRGPFQGAGWEC